MIEIGRICLKIAGRDAGKKCVILDIANNRVLIDGETRRKFVNPAHLLPLKQKIEIEKAAPKERVVEALKKIGIETRVTKPKKPAPKPVRKRKLKERNLKENL